MRALPILALLALSFAATLPATGHAQGTAGELAPDLRDIVPYMMVIVDTSGSMESVANCTCPGGKSSCPECLPNCTLSNTNGVPPPAKKNSWATTLEALTGSFQDFQCEKLARTIENGMSYDLGYPVSYYQPWDCVGTTSRACPYQHPDRTCTSDSDCSGIPQPFCVAGKCVAMKQNADGIFDQYKAQVQFGLMTFDGWDTYVGFPPLIATTDFNAALSESESGLWSYGGAKSFHYPNCTVDYMMDKGARSEIAEEGRLISLNSCNDSANCPDWCDFCDPNPEYIRNALNQNMQDSLLRARPYGGTPIAGALDDLYYHFENDMSDGFSGCRGRFSLLITDGIPDDDYRVFGCDCTQNDDATLSTYCGGPEDDCLSALTCNNHPDNMKCPYPTAAEVAHDLITGRSPDAPQMEKLFVVGMAVTDSGAKAKLNAIALQGGNPVRDEGANGMNSAYFADNLPSLMQSITKIIDDTIKPVSRAVPAFVGGTSGTGTAAQYQISTGFEKTATGLWAGLIERRRFTCGGVSEPDPEGQTSNLAASQLTERPIAASQGDLFHKRLDEQSLASRTLQTALPATGFDANGKLFKGATAPCGTSGCAMVALDHSSVDTARLGLTNSVPDQQKRTDTLDWMFGRNGSLRDPQGSLLGRRLGDVWHSSPIAVGAPRTDSSDEAFNLFRRQGVVKSRPLTLYVGSNDGILHGFAVEPWTEPAPGVKSFLAGQELFGFVPPLLLDDMKTNLVAHQYTMDGTPVVKDVYFQRMPTPTATMAQYHTVLITGMRNGGKGYVALDVTDPVNPKFLWQYTDSTMGYTFAQPSIVQAVYTTGGGRVERAVAVLSGGVGEIGLSGIGNDCSNGVTNPQMRVTTTSGGTVGQFKTLGAIPSGSTTALHVHRGDIRCWKDVGRSLHFVDVGTGKLIKKIHLVNPGIANGARIFTSPLVSTPAIFRDAVGTLASRGFVTDADGVIWRIDMSDPNQRPDDEVHDTNDPLKGWTVQPFHDIFWDHGVPGQAGYKPGELSYEAPLVSVDQDGNLVVIAGTGDTNNFLKATVENRVVSLTEWFDETAVNAQEKWKAVFNWEMRVKPGVTDDTNFVPSELVTGPMALSEGQLFFGTFISLAVGGNACDLGKGRVFAVDYRARDDTDISGTTPPTYGPKLLSVTDAGATDQASKDAVDLFNRTATQAEENLLVLGLSLTSRPSCTAVTTGIDDIWGQSVPYIDERAGGSADAVYLVAHASGDITNGTGEPILRRKGSQFGSVELKVQRAAKRARILSWATGVD